MAQHCSDFSRTENDRHMSGPFSGLDPIDSRQRPFDYMIIQERERREGLVLRGRRDSFIDGERRQESSHILLSKLARVTPARRDDVATNPMDIGFFRAPTVSTLAKTPSHDLHQAKPAIWIWIRHEMR
jgi:hypothetical protein